MKRTVVLSGGWRVRSLETNGRLGAPQVAALSGGAGEGWYPATMPRQVHEILVEAGRIDDPAGMGKAAECVWVSEKDWVYRVEFQTTETSWRAFLSFEGLDTLVDVYLNGAHLAYHNDQYLPLRVEVTGRLGRKNVLLLHFYSPHWYLRQCPMPKQWEGFIKKYKLLRKSDMDFVNFCGAYPYLTPIGVFDDIRLEQVDDAEIDDVEVTVRLTRPYATAKVAFRAAGTCETDGGDLVVTMADPDGKTVARTRVSLSQAGGKWKAEGRLTVERPRLWWPREYGSQPLYRLTAELVRAGRKVDQKIKTLGLRDLRMKGPFEFTVNGVAIKLWGANLTPVKGTRVWDPHHAATLLDLAENCHMNALRAWGPGAPYHESLYDEADRRGFLMWTEFFHDWGMYPDSAQFTALCRQEAEHYVRKLKHHASVLLWCGGNESHMGAEVDHPGKRYLGRELFEKHYPEICARLDPGRYYHPSSPSGGAFANDPRVGDSHAYNHMWYVPGEEFPIVFTEHTRISTPLLKTVKKEVDAEGFWPNDFVGMVKTNADNPLPAAWMKLAPSADFVISRLAPVEQFYDTVDTPEGLIYRFGSAHGLFIRRYVERFRRGRHVGESTRRRCQGHFLWKLNSTWPMIYSNIIDYELEPNIAYYALRRAYEPVLLSFEIGDHIRIWAVNDTATDVSGRLVFRLFDTVVNRTVAELTRPAAIRAGASEVLIDLDELGMFKRQMALYATLLDRKGHVIARSNDFADIERHLSFPDPVLTLSATDEGLEIRTDRFARSVELHGDDGGDEFGWYFEDNFFDLLPFETKRVRILGRHRSGRVTARSFFGSAKAELVRSRLRYDPHAVMR